MKLIRKQLSFRIIFFIVNLSEKNALSFFPAQYCSDAAYNALGIVKYSALLFMN